MRRAFSAVLAAVLLQACTATQPPSPGAQRLPDASELLAAVAERRQRVHGLRALAKLRYSSPAGSERARHVIAVQRPDRARIEIYSLFGTHFVLASSAGRFAAYLPSESTLYRGAASRENLSAYLPIAWSVAEIVDHVLATPPLRDGVRSTVEPDGGLVRLTQHVAGGRHSAWFRGSILTSYEEVDASGSIRFRVAYEGLAADPSSVPAAVVAHFPATRQEVEIALRDPEVNPVVGDEMFSLSPGPATREVDLDAGAPF